MRFATFNTTVILGGILFNAVVSAEIPNKVTLHAGTAALLRLATRPTVQYPLGGSTRHTSTTRPL